MDVVSESPEGGLRFNWTALGIFVSATALIVTATTAIYTAILKSELATVRREVLAADSILDRRIAISETIHLEFQRRFDQLEEEIKRVKRDQEELFRRQGGRNGRNSGPD